MCLAIGVYVEFAESSTKLVEFIPDHRRVDALLQHKKLKVLDATEAYNQLKTKFNEALSYYLTYFMHTMYMYMYCNLRVLI